jgi:dienelactone hydrolase
VYRSKRRKSVRLLGRLVALLWVMSVVIARADQGSLSRSPGPSYSSVEIAWRATQAEPPVTGVPAERTARGQTIADRFLGRDYAAVEASFDSTMKRALPLEKLKEARESLDTRLGAFKGQRGIRSEKYQQYDVVYVTWEFEKMTIDLRIVFDPSGKVAGLFFQPSQMAASAYVAPAYADTASFHEQEVTVGSGEWALPGTLAMPVGDGPFPAVVLVHGSGPNDRDETIGSNKPFRDLAWGLASRGIAVLRYEKRTKQHAVKFTGDAIAKLTVNEETVDDALAAVALLRGTKGIDQARVYVLGHSIGGMVLPRIGSADPRIAGLIVMAGPTRPLEDLIIDQVRYIATLDDTVSADEQATLDSLTAQVARVKSPGLSDATPAASLPLGLPAHYWLDLRGYNPAVAAKGLKQRMLILQGGRDYQVTGVDFDGWKTALSSRPDVEVKLYPDLNHLFIAGKGKSTPAEYTTTGHVAEQVIRDIAQWISSPASK